VLIPSAVYEELTTSKRYLLPAVDLAMEPWLVVATTVIGLLGVVIRAKRSGLIDQAKPLLDELIQTARFWIGPDLYAEVLSESGET
jgi:hypothetical protein